MMAVLAVAAASAGVLAGSEYDVIRETRTGALVDAVLHVHVQQLTKELAVECLNRFRSDHAGHPGLVRLSMFTNEGDARQYVDGRPTEVRRFQDWLKAARKPPQFAGDFTEVLWSMKGTVVRCRSREGQVQKFVVNGQDPSIIRRGKSAFEILHLFVVAPAPMYEDEPGGGRRVEFFFQVTGDLNEDDCRSVTEELSSRLDLPWMDTSFRRDPFFVFSELFPILHPLIKYPELPSEQSYRSGIGVHCLFLYRYHRSCSIPQFQ